MPCNTGPPRHRPARLPAKRRVVSATRCWRAAFARSARRQQVFVSALALALTRARMPEFLHRVAGFGQRLSGRVGDVSAYRGG